MKKIGEVLHGGKLTKHSKHAISSKKRSKNSNKKNLDAFFI
jgi:hypothetical protein